MWFNSRPRFYLEDGCAGENRLIGCRGGIREDRLGLLKAFQWLAAVIRAARSADSVLYNFALPPDGNNCYMSIQAKRRKWMGRALGTFAARPMWGLRS